MHRHGYVGRKFSRESDQRKALVKGLATQLIEHEAIETTIQKAKELVPYVEALITKAKKGDLHNRRQIVSSLTTLYSAHKLVDEIAPQLTARSSGHLRITKTRLRVGDNALLARVSFVDELKTTEPVVDDDEQPEIVKTPSSTRAKTTTSTPVPAAKVSKG